jgi:uncharacterized membrane protein YgdD (TMEM256/DUF423 family)
VTASAGRYDDAHDPATGEALRAMRLWLILGSLSAGLSVAAGAFAAHGLERFFVDKYGVQKRVWGGREMLRAEKSLIDFQTGAEYQMYHSLGLLAVGLMEERRRTVWLRIAGWAFLFGITLFSGGLYVYTLSGDPTYAMIVPIGGVAFLVGWAALAVASLKRGDTAA